MGQRNYGVEGCSLELNYLHRREEANIDGPDGLEFYWNYFKAP